MHGYDINCVTTLKNTQEHSHPMASHIVSGADEKVIRVFDPPFSFISTIPGFIYSNELSNEQVAQKLKEKMKTGEVAKHALGLMNKEIRVVEDEEGVADPSTFNPDEVLTNVKEELFVEST